jgi:hypothetical protein
LDNSPLDFATLGENFFSEIECQALKNPFLIHKNQALYNKLDLDCKVNASVVAIFSPCMAMEQRYSRIEERSTARPSAPLE